MKQVVILSGKGGTGKTTLSSMLAYEIHQDVTINHPVFVDADVDASNLELILSPRLVKKEDFSGGKVAIFDSEHCVGCQKCIRLCRFDAITMGPASPKDIQIDTISCEGCGLCALACPRGSITMENMVNGEWYQSINRFGSLFHANLYPGEENSGKLVSKVRQEAVHYATEEDSNLLLIDGPPGIGCPVIAAITGVDLAVIVTEPTLSGLHDLERIIQTVNHFNTPALVIINKMGLNDQITEEIQKYCDAKDIPIISKIPYEQELTNAIVNGKTIQEYAPNHMISTNFRSIWSKVKEKLFEINLGEQK